MQAVGILPSQQDLRGGSGFHRQHGTDWNGIAQTGGALHRGDAHALIALTSINLRRLAGAVEQRLQNRPGCRKQAILTSGGGQFRET